MCLNKEQIKKDGFYRNSDFLLIEIKQECEIEGRIKRSLPYQQDNVL